MKGIHRLKAEHLKKRKGPAKLCDGGGLWLYVKKTGYKSWVFRYRLHGNDHEMGLGSFNELSVSAARKKAQEYRELKNDGIDPINAKQDKLKRQRLEAAKGITFAECAELLIQSKKPEWKNKKHAQQWTNTLSTYAYPVIGELSISNIDTTLVMKILEPIWHSKTETATRLRQRIEAVIDWATVREYREGKNPAMWRGHLDKLLAKPSKIKNVQHHPALPYSEINSFIKDLRNQNGTAAKALELLILTASRSGEVRLAKWDEIDTNNKVWTIPKGRMKSNRLHRVPLSTQTIELLKSLHIVDDYVFPSSRLDCPISDGAIRQLMKRMNVTGYVAHGFRSTFRDWAAEQTNYPREVAEAALAHVLKDKSEAAYQRGDLLEKRRKLMQAWANYIDQELNDSKVINFKQSA